MTAITRARIDTVIALCALVAATLVGGCALGPRLVPAADAQTVPGIDKAAAAQAAGVRIIVVPDAWRGRPENLREEITPLKVSIENDGERPLRIRYNEFSLESSRGAHYAALPPIEIEGTVRQVADSPIYVPRFAYSGFYPAPYYNPPFAGLRAWHHPWAYDRFYYDRYYPVWEVRLPTRDMREMAIPEGVLERGGSVSGFLYFPRIQADARRIVFTADLHGGEDGKRFGELRVPFAVE